MGYRQAKEFLAVHEPHHRHLTPEEAHARSFVLSVLFGCALGAIVLLGGTMLILETMKDID